MSGLACSAADTTASPFSRVPHSCSKTQLIFLPVPFSTAAFDAFNRRTVEGHCGQPHAPTLMAAADLYFWFRQSATSSPARRPISASLYPTLPVAQSTSVGSCPWRMNGTPAFMAASAEAFEVAGSITEATIAETFFETQSSIALASRAGLF